MPYSHYMHSDSSDSTYDEFIEPLDEPIVDSSMYKVYLSIFRIMNLITLVGLLHTFIYIKSSIVLGLFIISMLIILYPMIKINISNAFDIKWKSNRNMFARSAIFYLFMSAYTFYVNIVHNRSNFAKTLSLLIISNFPTMFSILCLVMYAEARGSKKKLI